MPATATKPTAPDQPRRDLVCRSLQLRADSVDEQARSVEAVFATEQPVEVFDMRTYQVIEEVLRMDGAVLPGRVPLLDNHWRFSIDNVLGSAREARVTGDQVVGRLYFVADDEQVEPIWNKVRQGHLSDVSVGYRVREETTIPAGQSQEVAGRKYKATTKPLRIATAWAMRELSVVPVGADLLTKIRSAPPAAAETLTLSLLLSDLVREFTARGFNRRGLISEMAAAAGLSAGCVDDVIAGRVSCDRAEVLRGFAAVLDVKPEVLAAAVADDRPS